MRLSEIRQAAISPDLATLAGHAGPTHRDQPMGAQPHNQIPIPIRNGCLGGQRPDPAQLCDGSTDSLGLLWVEDRGHLTGR